MFDYYVASECGVDEELTLDWVVLNHDSRTPHNPLAIHGVMYIVDLEAIDDLPVMSRVEDCDRISAVVLLLDERHKLTVFAEVDTLGREKLWRLDVADFAELLQ